MTGLPLVPLLLSGVVALLLVLRRRSGDRAAFPADLAALAAALLLLLAAGSTEPPPPAASTAPAIALVVDVSASMGCASGDTTRLDAVRRELHTLVAGLPGAEFALVPFAGAATLQVPLSDDRDALRFFLDHLETGMVSAPGSAPEEALAVARQALAATQRPKLIVLCSDGERTLPGRAPAWGDDVPVFALPAGERPQPVPGRSGAVSTPDPERLRQLAAASGGTLLTTATVPAVLPLLQRWGAPAASATVPPVWWAFAALLLLVLRQWPLPTRRPLALAVALVLFGSGACRDTPPGSGAALFDQALALHRSGATEEAAATFVAAARQLDGGERGAALYNGGTLLLAAGQPQRALPLLEEALLLRPGDEAVRSNFILALRSGAPPPPGFGTDGDGAGDDGGTAGMERSFALQLLESVQVTPGGALGAPGRVTERRVERDW